MSGVDGDGASGGKTVLVVGAGPTGLILGIELMRRGVPVRLIDRLSEPLASSRAFTVHSRSLEVMDVLGLTGELKKKSGGANAKAMKFHFMPKEDKQIGQTVVLDFGPEVVRGRHPGILTVPQTVTERVLREGFEGLGGKIEWGVEMVGFTEAEGGVEVELGNGEKQAKFDFMIGCDGAASQARKQQDLEFAGLQFAGMTMKMMDVSLGGSLQGGQFAGDAYHYFVREKSMLLLAKMGDVEEYKGDTDVWRLLLSTTETKADMSVQNFQELVDKVVDGVKLGNPHWKVSYKIHRRMVSQYMSERGRVLLAGDAAHINSPAGGQGMNTALQDSFNLGWKLAMVCKGLAKEDILKTYEEERKPIAQKVLQGTDMLHSVIMAHGQDLSERLELATAERWLEKTVLRVSGQAFTHGKQEHEDLIGNDVVVGDGDKAPDILIVSAQDKIERLTACTAPYYILIIFDQADMQTASSLEEEYSKILTVVQAAPVDSKSTVTEENGAFPLPSDAVLKAQYGSCAAALVRPDRYLEVTISESADIKDVVTKSLSTLI